MSAPVYQMTFEQDIKKPIAIQHCGNLVFTGDNLSDTISVSMLEDGEPYSISGTVSMNCIRADGATVTVTGSVSGNAASATLTQACVAVPGPLSIVMKITSDSVTTTLLKAVYIVDVGVTGTAVDPGTIIPDINTLIDAIETAIGSIPADYSDLLAAIAPDFSNSIAYAAGAYVWYDGDLYKFTAAHAAGSWTGTDAETVVIGDEIADLNSALSEMPNIYESDAENVDLDISDNYGNVLMRLKDGEIHTKYFHSKPTIITLKTSGGDYSTLKDALDSITDADPETNPYEIHVYPGTYDTLEGFTDEEIRSADIGGGYTDDSMVGCKLTNGISLIGIGDRKKIILTAELSTSDYSSGIRGNISTLNLQGTCRIENLTIKAKNIRYCIHDDFGSSKHYERVVRNCVFSAYSWTLSYYPATTYGAGIASPGITALFEDCDFGFSCGYHTRASMTGDSKLVLRHCTGLTVRLGDQAGENDNAVHSFYFDGCDFAAVSITRSTATTPHIFAYGTNNLRSMLFCKAQDIPQFSSLMKTTVSALPVGTVVKVNNGGLTTTSEGITASKAESIDSAIGVIMYKDSEYDYIQRDGYIQGALLGLTSLSVGDYVTVDSDMALTTTGATESNAFGVVKYTDSNDRSQIWIMRR